MILKLQFTARKYKQVFMLNKCKNSNDGINIISFRKKIVSKIIQKYKNLIVLKCL